MLFAGCRLGLGSCLALLLAAGITRAQYLQDKPDEMQKLRELVEQQQKQIQELNQRLNTVSEQLGRPRKLDDSEKAGVNGAQDNPVKEGDAPKEDNAKNPLDANAVKKIIGDFLKDNPGIGMPPGVQTGFEAGRGFFIRSIPNPNYVKWQDESRIPFELRIRGRAQLDYYFYKVTDNLNHLTGLRYEPAAGDFSQIEAKRVRLFWEGTAFTPDLYYQFQIDGNTRGLGGFQSNRVIQTAGTSTPAASYGAPGIGTGVSPTAGGPASPIGGGDVVDHALRLFTAFVAYDIHLGSTSKGCGPDCCEGTYRYSPTLTFLVGKQQPFFGLTEILGSANAMFVDFSMADWFFDADDNNMLTAATVQYRDFDDRLFATLQITNGNESQFPNVQMDNLPGIITGFWYDFGGTWNEQAKRWNLFGNQISDLDYSVNPCLRVGGAVDIVPQNRRSIYGDVEQSRVLTMSAGPLGTRLINLLNGDSGTPAGSHAIDKFDYLTFDSWAAFHYRGFSLYNEWWLRNLSHLRTNPRGVNEIIYQDSSGANALYPTGHNLYDFGSAVQSGYFLIPKKFEIIARYDFISGDSGDINGNGRFTTRTIAGFTAPVRVIQKAFTNLHFASEIAGGFNYYLYGQLVKWSSDFSVYQGGNPAAGGSSPAGFIAGVDGWLVRTQIQLAF